MPSAVLVTMVRLIAAVTFSLTADHSTFPNESMIAGLFDHALCRWCAFFAEVWTKLIAPKTMVILKLSEMGNRRLIFITTVTKNRNVSIPLLRPT